MSARQIALDHKIMWIGGYGGTELVHCSCGHESKNTEDEPPWHAHIVHIAEMALKETPPAGATAEGNENNN